MNNAQPPAAQPWTITDPAAPPRPVASSAADEPRGLAWVPRRLLTRRSRMAPAVLALLACTAILFPWQVSKVLSYTIPVPGPAWAPSPETVAWIGVGLLGLVILPTLIAFASEVADEVRRVRSSRRAAARREQARQWGERFEIRREDLPAGPLREQADRLVAAVAAVEDTRTVRDGWAGECWERTLRVRRWSLISRLRDSVGVRADLDAAAGLDQRTPELDRIVAERTADVDALDAELAAEVDALGRLAGQARALDAALDAADAAQADRERADTLARRLGAPPDTAEELDQHHRRVRDLVLIEAPDADLSILGSGLDALTRHIAQHAAHDEPR